MNDLIEIKPNSLARGQKIFLKAKRGTQHVKATFLNTPNGIDFSAALEGSTTGFPLEGKEWDIFVVPEFPLPERTDIETTIYNLVAQGQITGAPPSYGDMADALIALIKGEVQTPVPVINVPQEPTAEQEQQFEAAHAQDFQEDADILMPTYDIADPEIDGLDQQN